MSKLNLSKDDYNNIISNYNPIPLNSQIPLTEELTKEAMIQAIERHSGRLVDMYTGNGKTTYAEGKDLTNVKYIIATGGALTRLPNRVKIIKEALAKKNDKILKPSEKINVLIDNDYIMASLGVLSKKHPKAALKLLKISLGIE